MPDADVPKTREEFARFLMPTIEKWRADAEKMMKLAEETKENPVAQEIYLLQAQILMTHGTAVMLTTLSIMLPSSEPPVTKEDIQKLQEIYENFNKLYSNLTSTTKKDLGSEFERAYR